MQFKQNIENQRAKSHSHIYTHRKWQKVIEPLTRYNRESSKFGYPIDFIYQLQKLVSSGYQLKINLPQTLSGTHDNCLQTVFATDSDMVGTLNFQSNVLKNSFETKVDKHIIKSLKSSHDKDKSLSDFFKSRIQTNIDQILPFVIIKEKNQMSKLNTYETSNFILTLDQYRKLPNIQVNQIAQCFIFSKFKYTSLNRFFYFPNKDHTSHAYKIDNFQTYIDKKMNKNCWKVKKSNRYGSTYVKIMYQNKSFFEQTRNLVSAIESKKKYTVQKIVSDWILDSQNRYWLTDIRQILLEQISQIPKIHKSLSQVLSIISCSVCKRSFKSNQIRKVVTCRLICQFFEHIKKRKIHISFHNNLKHSSDTCRVCDLCFMLVVAQSKLKNIEMKIAQASNVVSKKQGSLVLNYQQKYYQNMYNYRQFKRLYQWRLFFYIQDIKQFKIPQASLLDQKNDSILNKENSNSLRKLRQSQQLNKIKIRSSIKQTQQQKLVKAEPSEVSQKNYYIMIRIHDSITSFKISLNKTQKNNTSKLHHVPIKGIKVHYLFSQKPHIQQFLAKTEIVLRISDRNNWNAGIAEGSSYGLYEQTEKSSMRKFKQILVFNEKSQYCVAGIHIGIKNDGQCQNCSSLNMNAIFDAYTPNEQYTNCEPFPTEWMQIIDATYCGNKRNGSVVQYELTLNEKEAKKMLPNISDPKKKLKL